MNTNNINIGGTSTVHEFLESNHLEQFIGIIYNDFLPKLKQYKYCIELKIINPMTIEVIAYDPNSKQVICEQYLIFNKLKIGESFKFHLYVNYEYYGNYLICFQDED